MNYFHSETAAARYAAGRPDFHANTIDQIRKFLGITGKWDKALDVACGTGLSTKALLAIANEVYGTDISAEMIKHAPEPGRIQYSLAPAENQPFENEMFDLITVSSGLHWFNIDAFLTEANRLLKPGGRLVIYENYFTGEMDGNDEFKEWLRETYLQRFPSPPRNKHYDWSAENLRSKNFSIQMPENFKNPVSFSKRQMINYFTTQSNIIAVVERGEHTFPEAEQWLANELSRFFKDENASRIISYGNWIKYLQKI